MTGIPRRAIALVVARPLTRRECTPDASYIGEPCPFVTCKHHLAIDLKYTKHALSIASISPRFLRWLNDDSTDPGPTCALDVARDGSRIGLDEIRTLMGAGMSQQLLSNIFHGAFDALPLEVIEYLRETLLAS